MMRKLAMLALVTVATSGCTPRARPYGMGAGAVTAVAGALLLADSHPDDCNPDVVSGLTCLPVQTGKATLSASLIGFGAVIFLVAVLSPGEPKPDVDPRPVPVVPAANGDPLVRARPVIDLGFD